MHTSGGSPEQPQPSIMSSGISGAGTNRRTTSSSSRRRQQQPPQRTNGSTSNNSRSSQAPKKLSAQFLLDYERRGFCVTKGLLQPDQLEGPVKDCVKATIQQQRLQALKHRSGNSNSNSTKTALLHHLSCTLLKPHTLSVVFSGFSPPPPHTQTQGASAVSSCHHTVNGQHHVSTAGHTADCNAWQQRPRLPAVLQPAPHTACH